MILALKIHINSNIKYQFLFFKFLLKIKIFLIYNFFLIFQMILKMQIIIKKQQNSKNSKFVQLILLYSTIN